MIGCPAEEGGGGKLKLIEAGVFDDVDVAMMSHPSVANIAEPKLPGIKRCLPYRIRNTKYSSNCLTNFVNSIIDKLTQS